MNGIPADAVLIHRARSCGTCSLCCKVAAIPELQKPAGVWCVHARPGKGGCSIYDSPERPGVCRTFQCAWVEREDGLPGWMKPDRVHAYVTGLKGRNGIAVHVDPGYPDAWRTDPLATFLRRTSMEMEVAVAVGRKRWAILRGQLVRGPDAKEAA